MMRPDLELEKLNVISMLKDKCSLRRIYKELRNKVRWNSYGDYILIHFIYQTAKELGIFFTPSDITKVLKTTKDKEFTKIRTDSEIVRQFSA